jgi:hypothetical protein
VFIRVPLLVQFGEFAQRAGATSLEDLPSHIESFVDDRLNRLNPESPKSYRQVADRGLRNPIKQMLRLVIPNLEGNAEGRDNPFRNAAPGFFEFLRRERGLSEATLVQYRHCLQLL